MLQLDSKPSTMNSGYSYYLSGDELGEIKELLSDIPHKASPLCIEFSPLYLSDVCDMLVDYDITSERSDIRRKISQQKPKRMAIIENPVLPKFKLSPHEYQKDAIKYGIEHPRFLLGDEMGLGKSGTTIFLAEILKAYYGFKHTLIICGVNGAKFNWQQIEIPKFSYESAHIIGGRVNRNGNFVIDDVAGRIADLQAPHDEFYLILNIESLRNKELTGVLKSMIMDGTIGLVVIDEIHECSGRTSMQGKAIHELRPKFRVGLTGTPVHNKPFDLYNILKWLGYEHRNFGDFRQEYAYEIPKTTMVNGRVVEFFEYVYKDLSMLHSRLKTIMLRRTVDVLHLPTPVFKNEYVELDKDQLKLYNKIKEDIKKSASYLGSLTANNFMSNPAVQFLKARQAVSCPNMFGVKSDAKLEKVIDIAKEAIENGKSIVVFAWFNATIDQYVSVLGAKFPGSVLAVTDTTKNAQDIISQFQNTSEPRILIGTIGKLGTSFTITRADIVIFVDKHVVWSDYKQAYMRVWRQGQTKTIVIINIMAKDTVDERLEYLISLGRSHSSQIVDGEFNDDYLFKRYRIEDLL